MKIDDFFMKNDGYGYIGLTIYGN